jgi:propanediol dehydratase small subunit
VGFTPAELDGKLHAREVRVRNRTLKVRAQTTHLAGRSN